jgi:hypothetical protein
MRHWDIGKVCHLCSHQFGFSLTGGFFSTSDEGSFARHILGDILIGYRGVDQVNGATYDDCHKPGIFNVCACGQLATK